MNHPAPQASPSPDPTTPGARAVVRDAETVMTALAVGVLRETALGEHRVALDPSAVKLLCAAGRSVLIEPGAGAAASFPDALYASAGARLVARAEVVADSTVVAVVRPPDSALVASLREGQTLIGLLDPLGNLSTVQQLADRQVTIVAFEMIPRTLSRAQSMDALSSQSSAAGYRAAIVAAEAFGGYLPMMITASGTATPAKVIVIGTGVAGLQAIATCHRLGAIVTGYDVREASRGEVESLGAAFVAPSVANGAGGGGYARALTEAEQDAQQTELATLLESFDVIITTAKVPGHTPPILVSAATLAKLRPGSVCIDLGASDKGGNVAGSVDGKRIMTPGGVTVIGGGELAADLPTSSSQMYGRNVTSVIASLYPADVLVIDPADEVHQHIVIASGGQITNEAVRDASAPVEHRGEHRVQHLRRRARHRRERRLQPRRTQARQRHLRHADPRRRPRQIGRRDQAVDEHRLRRHPEPAVHRPEDRHVLRRCQAGAQRDPRRHQDLRHRLRLRRCVSGRDNSTPISTGSRTIMTTLEDAPTTAESSSNYKTVNPNNGTTVQTFPTLTAAELEAKLATAQACFATWKTTTYAQRAAIISTAASLLRARVDDFAQLATLEMGKRFAEAQGEVEFSANILDYYATNSEAFLQPVTLHPTAGEGHMEASPFGVLFCVEPWNFPYYQLARVAGPHLMAGNTIVVKHAGCVPRSRSRSRSCSSMPVHRSVRTPTWRSPTLSPTRSSTTRASRASR